MSKLTSAVYIFNTACQEFPVQRRDEDQGIIYVPFLFGVDELGTDEFSILTGMAGQVKAIADVVEDDFTLHFRRRPFSFRQSFLHDGARQLVLPVFTARHPHPHCPYSSMVLCPWNCLRILHFQPQSNLICFALFYGSLWHLWINLIHTNICMVLGM